MTTNDSYIMREQVENPIPSIMSYRAASRRRENGRGMYILSVTAVTLVYLLAMTFSAD